MERFTKFIDGGTVWVTVEAHEDSRYFVRGKAIDRLAAYEDTGLTPEEIQEVVDLFKGRCDDVPSEVKSWAKRCTWHVGKCNELSAELRKYRKAEAERRLVVLPCMVGDLVYSFTSDRVVSGTVFGFERERDGEWIAWANMEFDSPRGGTGYPFSDFGNVIFLTREEAEAALANMKGRKDV